MTVLYDPVDDITYYVLLGDNCRYSTLPSGTTAAAYLGTVPDDSGWATGPQPLIKTGVVPNTVIAPPQFGMNEPFAYTSLPIDTLAGEDPVGQFHLTIPPGVRTGGAANWKFGLWIGGNVAVFIDGVSAVANVGSNFETLFPTVAQQDAFSAGGTFTIGFHGGGAGVNWGAGFTLFNFGDTRSGVPLRQHPRDDALGGTPRQGHTSTSVQSSARQGWAGTYR